MALAHTLTQNCYCKMRKLMKNKPKIYFMLIMKNAHLIGSSFLKRFNVKSTIYYSVDVYKSKCCTYFGAFTLLFVCQTMDYCYNERIS